MAGSGQGGARGVARDGRRARARGPWLRRRRGRGRGRVAVGGPGVSRFAVDLELLDELVAELAAAGRSLAEIRSEVDRDVRRLQVSWDGGAARAQAAAQRRWTAAETGMRAALEQLREIASGALDNYRAAVVAN